MASQAKRSQKASSPSRRKPPKARETAEQRRLRKEVDKHLEHEAALNAEYAGLLKQRESIDAELERVQRLANQVLGRLELLREMRGDKPPLPSVSEMGQQASAAANGTKPEGEDG